MNKEYWHCSEDGLIDQGKVTVLEKCDCKRYITKVSPECAYMIIQMQREIDLLKLNVRDYEHEISRVRVDLRYANRRSNNLFLSNGV